jgi:SYF2 splicing factor
MQKKQETISNVRGHGIGPWKNLRNGTDGLRKKRRIETKRGLQVSTKYVLCVLTCVDYTQIAEKSYRQDLKGFKPDLEGYQKAKEEALSKGQIVEQKGELVVLDEDGRFYANANSLGVMEHKPSKEAVDRLVAETRKREADKEAKRRKKRAGEDGDVSYINKRNKVFNEKLSRYDPDDEDSSDFAIGFMISILEKQGRRSSEGVLVISDL